MKSSEASMGRVFILRLEDGETVHEVLEKFAQEKHISSAAVILLGGAAEGSKLVVGPKDPGERPVIPMETMLGKTHEIAGVGTIFPNESGRPVSHIHVASGRGSSTITGCIRAGMRTWQVVEVVVFEILGTKSRRMIDPATGFELLEPDGP